MRLLVMLACGCERMFPSPIPPPGADLLCTIHGATRRVSSISWQVKCEQCRYSRPNLGNSPLAAETVATAHALKRHHRVRVWRAIDQLASETYWVPKHDQISLPLVYDAAPF